jgi:hypothetical protein
VFESGETLNIVGNAVWDSFKSPPELAIPAVVK